MSLLINGFTVLKRETLTTKDFNDRPLFQSWRLVTNGTEYRVHLEQLFHNGGSAEGLLYSGNSLDAANSVYNRYVVRR